MCDVRKLDRERCPRKSQYWVQGVGADNLSACKTHLGAAVESVITRTGGATVKVPNGHGGFTGRHFPEAEGRRIIKTEGI